MLQLRHRVRLSGFAAVALLPALLFAPVALTAGTTVETVALGPVRVLGTGTQPGLYVDPAGTAYVAWNGPGSPSPLRFCRVARSASACTAGLTTTITTVGTTSTRPFVVAWGARVVVISYRYPTSGTVDFSGAYAYTSMDGGDTFAAGVEVGDLPYFEAVHGPGDTLAGVTNAHSNGTLFQSVPLGGGSAVGSHALLSASRHHNGSVGLINATTPLAVFADGSSSGQWRKYDGSGPVNDAANWSPPSTVGYVAYPKLAAGRTGVFMVAGNSTGRMTVRKFNGSGFSAALSLGAGDSPRQHAFQDFAGRVHSVVQFGDAAGLHLRHWVSDNGVAWRSITVAHQNPGTAGAFNDPRVAVAPDHVGVAVWSASTAGTIRLVAVAGVPKPRPRLTLSGTARRTRTGVPVTISGTLVRPVGVPAVAGCTGTVKVNLKRGSTVIYTKTVAVRATCRFSFSTTLGRAKVGNATTRLGVVARFSGNPALLGVVKSRTIPIS